MLLAQLCITTLTSAHSFTRKITIQFVTRLYKVRKFYTCKTYMYEYIETSGTTFVCLARVVSRHSQCLHYCTHRAAHLVFPHLQCSKPH